MRTRNLIAVVLPCLIALVAALPVAQAASVLVFYETAERGKPGGDIYFQRLSLDGKLGWGDDTAAKALATSADVELAPAACSDGAGGAIVAYQYLFIAGEHQGDLDVVAQRVDAQGNLLWKGGEPVGVGSSGRPEAHPVVVSDGCGGAFVVYEWESEQKQTDVLAQRVDADGNLLWNEGKRAVVVAGSERSERAAVVVPDGQGGIIVVFEWEGAGGNIDVMAQRISADGKVLWQEGKRAADVAATPALERHPAALADGQGGAFIVFESEYTAGEHKGDVDVLAQRIAGDGHLVWTEPQDVGTAPGLERSPIAISDGVGGVIAAFEYEPVTGENAGDIDLLAQRLNPDGQMMWNEGKRSVMISSSKRLERTPRGLPTADGGAIFVVESEPRDGERAGDVDLMAQRLNPDGTMAWEKGERSVTVSNSKWLEGGAVVLPDGAAGALVIFTMTGPKGEFEGDQDVDAMRLSRDGVMLWNEGKKPVDVAGEDILERNPCAVLAD